MAAGVTNGIVVVPETLGVRVRRTVRRLRRLPLLPVSILLALVFCGITAPWISPADPVNGELSDRRLPPVWGGAKYFPKTVVEDVAMGQRSLQVAIGSDEFQQAVAAQGLSAEEVALGDKLLVKTRDGGSTKYFLGSDQLGRDLLSRIFHGARISLIVAAITLGVGGTIGTFAGLVSGYYGGWVDEFIMRLVDIVLSIPVLLVTLVLVASLGASFELIVRGAVADTMAPFRAGYARRGAPTEEHGLRGPGPGVWSRRHAYHDLSSLTRGLQYLDSHRHAERRRGYPG